MKKESLGSTFGLRICFLVFIGFTAFFGTSWAQYPERPITIIVGSDPGGPIDMVARTMAASAEKELGQPIIIENKAGGAGDVALGILQSAKPDGYTLCAVINHSIAGTPLMQKVPFKPLKSFTPIAGYAVGEHTGLVVKSDAPWKTFKEFLEYAKQNPGKVKYSSSGIGMSAHMVMESIARKDGVKWVHIPFKGNPAAVTAVLGGHVDACTSGVDFVPQVKAGALRVLLTHGRQRSPNFPDVPTAMELGYSITSENIHSIVGPAGLPAAVVQKLETAIKRATETPQFKSAIERIYVSPFYCNSKEYEQRLKDYWVKTEKLLKDVGIIQEPATQPY
jgi:tripartite-type tricarboxylate transporter receptor subunit TctC